MTRKTLSLVLSLLAAGCPAAGPAEEGCPTPDGPGVRHAGPITADCPQTWPVLTDAVCPDPRFTCDA